MTIALGLLLSGSGSNAQAIMDRAREGALDADIRLVVANNPSACGLERARAADMPTQRDRKSVGRERV